MPLTALLPWILTAVAASIAAMVTGVQSGVPVLSWTAALAFAAVLIAVSVDVNRPWWHLSADADTREISLYAAIRNARLLILGYLWGSFALIAMYRLTGLRWQHGLQYAAGMALIAWLILVYVHVLSRPGSLLARPAALAVASRLSMAHGAGAMVGLVFLIATGKIFSKRADWAANQVFLAGGIAIVALSLVAAITQFKLGLLPADGKDREMAGAS